MVTRAPGAGSVYRGRSRGGNGRGWRRRPARRYAGGVVEPSVPIRVASRAGLLRAVVRGAATAFVVACVVPATQCVWLRFFDPPFTLTMIEAVDHHHDAHGAWTWPAYDDVDLDEVPRCVVAQFVASEDQRFFDHHGFDVEAIRRAWESNRKGGRLRGGSTISQQVARNAFLWQGRNWLRKGLEVWYTVWLELIVPKERILDVYLQIAELGPVTFGLESAARHWYGKPAAELTCREAAHLASILPSPRSRTPRSGVVRRHAAWVLSHPVELPPGIGRDD